MTVMLEPNVKCVGVFKPTSCSWLEKQDTTHIVITDWHAWDKIQSSCTVIVKLIFNLNHTSIFPWISFLTNENAFPSLSVNKQKEIDKELNEQYHKD